MQNVMKLMAVGFSSRKGEQSHSTNRENHNSRVGEISDTMNILDIQKSNLS